MVLWQTPRVTELRLPAHIDETRVLALMVERARNPMMLIGTGRRPLYANQAFLELSGYSLDEWMSHGLTSSLSPERDLVDSSKNLNQALQGTATAFRARPLVRKNGSEVWVEGSLTPLAVDGERFLLAEFRPPYGDPPDGVEAWRPGKA